jgi:hypothetical protein
MVLTAKQVNQLQKAPTKARQQALRTTYARQDQTRTSTQRGRVGLRRSIPQRVPVNRLASMPQAQDRGQPDSKANWNQTPASSNVIAPRGFGYYDAFEHDPYSVATAMSIGPATPVVGTTICNQLETLPSVPMDVSGLETGMILLIVQPSCQDVQAVAYRCNGTGDSNVIVQEKYRSDQLRSDGPDNAIPTRCSLRLRNWTQHVGVGGIVRTLRMTTGVALRGDGQIPGMIGTTNLAFAQLCGSIRVNQRTRTYGGEELIHAHQKNCSVVDQAKATWFKDWSATYQNDQFPWTRLAGWDQDGSVPAGQMDTFTQTLHDPAYTPIAILFEPFVAAVSNGVVGNQYEVNVRSQFLCHYAQGTMLANMAVDPPSKLLQLTAARDHEEGKGSVLEKVGNVIRDGASYSWNNKSTIIKSLCRLQAALG